jgi:hypothetical protein
MCLTIMVKGRVVLDRVDGSLHKEGGAAERREGAAREHMAKQGLMQMTQVTVAGMETSWGAKQGQKCEVADLDDHKQWAWWQPSRMWWTPLTVADPGRSDAGQATGEDDCLQRLPFR